MVELWGRLVKIGGTIMGWFDYGVVWKVGVGWDMAQNRKTIGARLFEAMPSKKRFFALFLTN